MDLPWTRDGVTERLYEVENWRPEYRENPRDITIAYAPGELVVQPGDVFTTNCTWVNNTGQNLDYPYEMCSLHGAYGPATRPLTCAGTELR